MSEINENLKVRFTDEERARQPELPEFKNGYHGGLNENGVMRYWLPSDSMAPWYAVTALKSGGFGIF